MVFCEMCGAEINPGEDVLKKGRVICQACAEVVGSKSEGPAEDMEEESEEEE